MTTKNSSKSELPTLPNQVPCTNPSVAGAAPHQLFPFFGPKTSSFGHPTDACDFGTIFWGTLNKTLKTNADLTVMIGMLTSPSVSNISKLLCAAARFLDLIKSPLENWNSARLVLHRGTLRQLWHVFLVPEWTNASNILADKDQTRFRY